MAICEYKNAKIAKSQNPCNIHPLKIEVNLGRRRPLAAFTPSLGGGCSPISNEEIEFSEIVHLSVISISRES